MMIIERKICVILKIIMLTDRIKFSEIKNYVTYLEFDCVQHIFYGVPRISIIKEQLYLLNYGTMNLQMKLIATKSENWDFFLPYVP